MTNEELDKFEENLISALNGGNNEYISAYRRVLDQYGYTHGRRHDNVCQLYDELYSAPIKESKLGDIAIKYGISDSTLLRRRKDFRDCFCYYLKIIITENNIKSEAATAANFKPKKD